MTHYNIILHKTLMHNAEKIWIRLWTHKKHNTFLIWEQMLSIYGEYFKENWLCFET